MLLLKVLHFSIEIALPFTALRRAFRLAASNSETRFLSKAHQRALRWRLPTAAIVN